MWFLNKNTGVRWDITSPDVLKRVRADADFEPCEPPAEKSAAPAQAPGASAVEPVLPAEGGGRESAAAPGPEQSRKTQAGKARKGRRGKEAL